jgi:hypothetical protein
MSRTIAIHDPAACSSALFRSTAVLLALPKYWQGY